jgi:tetratricopeptide (TPR) repeat protein
MAQGQPQRGLSLLQAEAAKHPADKELKLALADATRLAGDHERARSLYEELLREDPRSSSLLVRLANTYYAVGQTQKALDLYTRAIDVNPNDADALYRASIALSELQRRPEALKLCERLVQLQPDNPYYLNNLAYLLAETGGDLDRALTYAQRATRTMPQMPEFTDTLGWIYIKKHIPARAFDLYRELVAKRPSDPLFRYRLALAASQVGDKETAQKAVEAALRLSPPPDQKQQLQELLAALRTAK